MCTQCMYTDSQPEMLCMVEIDVLELSNFKNWHREILDSFMDQCSTSMSIFVTTASSY